VTEHDKTELDRHFAWFEGKLPAEAGPLCRLAAQALFAVGANSSGHFVDCRRRFQFFAGAGTVDAPARTSFGRAGRAAVAEAHVANARMDRAQMGRADRTWFAQAMIASARVGCERMRTARRANRWDHCPALRAKIFCFLSDPNHLPIPRHPVPEEGRWPSSRTLGRDAVDAEALLTNSA
jgi:hypothetical protein